MKNWVQTEGVSFNMLNEKGDIIVVANGKAGGYCISHFPLCTHTCLRFQIFPVICSNSAVISALLRIFCSQVLFRQETEIYKFGTHYSIVWGAGTALLFKFLKQPYLGYIVLKAEYAK